MHGQDLLKFQSLLKRYRTTDPQLLRYFRLALDEVVAEARRVPQPLLHTYAIAERRVCDHTYFDMNAVAEEWGIAHQFAAVGQRAIEDALRTLRNAALATEDQTYIASNVAGALWELQRDKND